MLRPGCRQSRYIQCRGNHLLPYWHRVGTITREQLWGLYPKSKAEFFATLSKEEIDEFLVVNPERIDAGTAPLASMTANDFYRCCFLGYLANGYACKGLTPKEQVGRFADGRDEGLQELPPDEPEAFAAWLEHRGGGHPWKVCRGGSSTHISLYVKREPGQGCSMDLWGSSVDHCVENIKFLKCACMMGGCSKIGCWTESGSASCRRGFCRCTVRAAFPEKRSSTS